MVMKEGFFLSIFWGKYAKMTLFLGVALWNMGFTREKQGLQHPFFVHMQRIVKQTNQGLLLLGNLRKSRYIISGHKNTGKCSFDGKSSETLKLTDFSSVFRCKNAIFVEFS